MRLFNRFLLPIALVASATSLTPGAVAEDVPSPSARAVSGSSTTANPARGVSGTRARTVDPSLTASITAEPPTVSTSGTATFRFVANRAHVQGVRSVQFRCTLTRPGQQPVTDTCPYDDTTSSTTTGVVTYSGLTGNRTGYTFSVEPYIALSDPGNEGTDELVGTPDSYSWHIFTVFAKMHYSLRSGASFNRPEGSLSQRRASLNRVIRTINSMPGYREAYPGLCPSDPALIPGSIKISSYSLTDDLFASAVVAARRRCISVQVLMNDHLNRTTDAAWRTMEDGLGTRRVINGAPASSFAHRCNSGCRGGGVMHTKMFLFNSTLQDTSKNTYKNIVMFGSSNMTQNAAHVQYNDLYVQRGRPVLYSQFARMFDLMKADDGYHRNQTLPSDGPYQATFWPLVTKDTTDPYVAALRSVQCAGATGGTGINGRTVVYINMHAWFGTRGLGLANQVRGLYNRGCYVRVLYSFMSYGVFKELHQGTGSRMSVRRTLFSHNGKTAYLYSHLKNIDVSGHVGSDTSAKVAWTGSNNFTNEGNNFDEVTVRMAVPSAYNAYVAQFKWISAHKSSSVYANFSEPSGGGRAPAPKIAAARSVPAGTPVITSPDVEVGADGRARALD